MNAIANKQIALRISGTKQRQAGFVPLVAVGVLAGNEGDNMDRTTVLAAKPIFVIKHAPDYILYQAIDRKVKSFDANPSGVLSIAITIPKQYQLAGHNSPYTLLTEIYRKFVSEYMTPMQDGRDSFTNKTINDEVFREILSRYPLESRKSSYVVMNQNPNGLTATLRLREDNIEAFFRDSHYEEFSQYKDIEIGFECNTTVGLEDLEIPRPQKYEVFVNGRSAHKFMTRPSDVHTTNESDTEGRKYHNISFSLNDVLNSPDCRYQDGISYAELDDSGRINCTVGYEEKKYICRITVSGVSEDIRRQVLSYFDNGQISITIGDRDLTSFRNDDEYVIPHSALHKTVSVRTYNGIKIDGYEISNSARLEKNRSGEVAIDMKLTKTPAAIPPVKKDFDYNSRPKPEWADADRYKQTEERQSYEEQPYDDSADDYDKPKSVISTRKASLYMILMFLLGLFCGLVATYLIVKHAEEKRTDKTDKTEQQDEYADDNHSASAAKTGTDAFAAEGPTPHDVGESGSKDGEEQVDEGGATGVEDTAGAVAKTKSEQAAAEAAAKALAEAKAKAEAEKAAAADAKEQARVEILKLVNAKDLNGCTKHSGWKTALTERERWDVALVLNYTPSKPKDGYKYNNSRTLKAKVAAYLETIESFNDYEDLKEARLKIQKIESDELVKQ